MPIVRSDHVVIQKKHNHIFKLFQLMNLVYKIKVTIDTDGTENSFSVKEHEARLSGALH